MRDERLSPVRNPPDPNPKGKEMTDIINPAAVEETLAYDPDARIVVIDESGNPISITAHNLTYTLRDGNRFKVQVQNYKGKVTELGEYIKENLAELGDNAQDIADIFDIELTRAITWTATVDITITGTLPIDIDPNDIEISEYISIRTEYASDIDDLDMDFDFRNTSWSED